MHKISVLYKLIFSNTAKNSIGLFLGNSLMAFFAFLFTTILIRMMTVEEFGYFSTTLAFMVLVVELFDLGIGSSLLRFIPELKKNLHFQKQFLTTAFIIQLVSAICIFVFVIVLTPFISNILFHDNNYNILIYISSFGIFGLLVQNFFYYAILSKENYIHASLLSASGGLLRLLSLIFIIYTVGVSVVSVTLGQSLSFLVHMAIAIILLNLNLFKLNMKMEYLKKLLKFAIYIGIARGVTSLSVRLDQVMLVSLTDAYNAGIYATAARIISFYPMITGSFVSVISPVFSKIDSGKDLNIFMKKVIIATFGIICTIIFLYIFADFFIIFLFTEKAIEAIGVFRILLLGMIFFVASIPAVALAVYYLKKPHILTVNSILQLSIVFFGNLFFIPKYGYYGPAITLIFSYSISLLFTVCLTFHYYKVAKKVSL
jgi:O-antigen/teichoic acid export membrane protein